MHLGFGFKECASCGPVFSHQHMNVLSPQLSQAAASIENRVPTPSSVASADTSSQQPGSEVPMLEIKPEVKTDDAEPDVSEPQGEPGSEVGAAQPLRDTRCRFLPLLPTPTA